MPLPVRRRRERFRASIVGTYEGSRSLRPYEAGAYAQNLWRPLRIKLEASRTAVCAVAFAALTGLGVASSPFSQDGIGSI